MCNAKKSSVLTRAQKGTWQIALCRCSYAVVMRGVAVSVLPTLHASTLTNFGFLYCLQHCTACAIAASTNSLMCLLCASRVWGPKVAALSTIQSLSTHQPLSFSLLFSSVASLIGSAGQANYAVANSALDAAAAADRARGVVSCSVRWGAWAGKLHGTILCNTHNSSRSLTACLDYAASLFTKPCGNLTSRDNAAQGLI